MTQSSTEKHPILFWFGDRVERSGWATESVATNQKRMIDHYTRKDGKVVRVREEELVHVHHGYRPRLDGAKFASKDFFFRGARICRP